MKKNLLFLLLILIVSCNKSPEVEVLDTKTLKSSFEEIDKPYTRYWWFASEIKNEDIKFNLDWLKENGFGGVEIAWVYPLNAMANNKLDTSYIPRHKWLSPQWQASVKYAMEYCDSIGLGCDFTMGTLWPFGDTQVSYEQASQQYGDSARQEIHKSWEYPKVAYVVDHLKPSCYLPYFQRMLDAFPKSKTKVPQSYFIDSWEVEAKKLWTDGFGDEFKKKFNYDIRPLMDSIYEEGYEEQLYDYRYLISEKVVKFYQDFDSSLNANNIVSRGQCSGAPCDIISAYSKMDIPESEALLYEPSFSNIPASAAVLSKKNVVSSESFTCLYGWPRDYLRQEEISDLKILADALFANGVNHIVWHGKPHNPINTDSVDFYASVHVGPEGNLAKDIAPFNHYLSKVSKYMKKGVPYTDIAVYIPTADNWIKGIMPIEKQYVWAWGYYEMRHTTFSNQLENYHPTWINNEFLQTAKLENGILSVGDAKFQALYLYVEYLEYEALIKVCELADAGFPVILEYDHDFKEPGTKKHKDYDKQVKYLLSKSSVSTTGHNTVKPLIEYDYPILPLQSYPNYRARVDKDTMYIFFATPIIHAKNIKFPMDIGVTLGNYTKSFSLFVNFKSNKYNLDFDKAESTLYKLYSGEIDEIEIRCKSVPKQNRKSKVNKKQPWKVKRKN